MSFIKAGTMIAADTPGDLRRIWQNYELTGPVPDADFTRYVVVVLADYDVCEGGHGMAEIHSLLVRRDGRVRPEFVGTPRIACEEGRYRFTPTSVYALAVRRDRIPAARLIFAGSTRTVLPSDWRRSEPVGACEVQAPPAPLRPGADSVLTVPPPGSIWLEYLSDGTHVFVVRHLDATVDVLAADTVGWFDRMESRRPFLRGLREPIEWQCWAGRLAGATGTYDEYGVVILGIDDRSLDRYRATVLPDGRLLVAPNSRGPGYPPRRPAPPLRRTDPPTAWSRERAGNVDLAQALLLPAGSRIAVDADLVLGGGAGPLLCKTRQGTSWPRCDGPGVPALGVTWAEPSEWTIRGPFSVRVADGGLAEVTYNGWTPIPDAVIRPLAWGTAKVEASLAALGAVSSTAGYFGAEGTLSVRATFWPSDAWPMWLVGADTGVALRGRWLQASRGPTSDVRAGFAVLLEDSDEARDWTYPSPLGLLVPEVGIGGGGGDVLPYLGWSLPVTYHLESIRLRRHPFGARDVLGIRVAPTALLSMRTGSNEWQYGLSIGATLW